MIVANASRAMCLNSPIYDTQCHIRGDDFDHRNLASGRFVTYGIHQMSRMHRQQPRLINFISRVGDFGSNRSLLSERLTEGDSRLNSAAHRFKGSLGQPYQSHAMMDSAWSESTLGNFKASPLTQQHVVNRNSNIFKHHFRVTMWSVIVTINAQHFFDGDAGRVKWDEDHRLLLMLCGGRIRLAHENA